jgi:hypothetical protein
VIVIIRHGEKPENGDNLSCKGLNRALQLPAVIKNKFGVPNFIYVPGLKMNEKTTRARMFETAMPLAVKFNLGINSKFQEEDSVGVVKDILQKQGVVLVIWEHKAISGIMHQLGVQNAPEWQSNDYNTILEVIFKNGQPILTRDSEDLNPSDNCP